MRALRRRMLPAPPKSLRGILRELHLVDRFDVPVDDDVYAFTARGRPGLGALVEPDLEPLGERFRYGRRGGSTLPCKALSATAYPVSSPW